MALYPRHLILQPMLGICSPSTLHLFVVASIAFLISIPVTGSVDLGLALSWEVRETLRSNLMLVVMSATLDSAPVAKLLNNAPVVTSEGRSYPVEIIHLNRPRTKEASLEIGISDLILKALKEIDGFWRWLGIQFVVSSDN